MLSPTFYVLLLTWGLGRGELVSWSNIIIQNIIETNSQRSLTKVRWKSSHYHSSKFLTQWDLTFVFLFFVGICLLTIWLQSPITGPPFPWVSLVEGGSWCCVNYEFTVCMQSLHVFTKLILAHFHYTTLLSSLFFLHLSNRNW